MAKGREESLKGRDKLCNSGHFAAGAGKDYPTLFRVPDQRAVENPGWRQGLAGLVQGLPWAGKSVPFRDPFRDKKGSSQILARSCHNLPSSQAIGLHSHDFEELVG